MSRGYGTSVWPRSGVERRERRAVKKGDVILSSTPFAHVIDHAYLSMYCDTCVAQIKECLLQPCRDCRVAWYCSEKCRLEGLAWHRLECPALKRTRSSPPQDFVRLLARVIFRLRDGGDKYVEKYSDREGRRFRDLMNHYADIKNSEELQKDARNLMEELGRYIGERFLPNFSDFLGIYGRVLVNRFSFIDKTMLNIGSAVYLAASIFDHDCSANCFISFDGPKVVIRSLVDMPVLNYSKFRISYVDPVTTAAARRQDLYKKWFFYCDCKTCGDQQRASFENSVTCENRDCELPVALPEVDSPSPAMLRQKRLQEESMINKGEEKETSVETGEKEEEKAEEETGAPACGVCGRAVGEDRVRQYWDTVAFTREKLKGMTEENPTMEYCLEMMDRQKGFFSPLNAWRVRTLDFAFNAALFKGCWSLALQYGEDNHDGMRFYYGADNPTFSLFLFKLGKAKIYFKEFREGVRILEEAESRLRLALGDSHSILEELRLVSLMANEDLDICIERRIAAAQRREEEQLKQQQQQQQQQQQLQQLLMPWLSCRDDAMTKLLNLRTPIA